MTWISKSQKLGSLSCKEAVNEGLNDSAKDTKIVLYFFGEINCLPAVIAETNIGGFS